MGKIYYDLIFGKTEMDVAKVISTLEYGGVKLKKKLHPVWNHPKIRSVSSFLNEYKPYIIFELNNV